MARAERLQFQCYAKCRPRLKLHTFRPTMYTLFQSSEFLYHIRFLRFARVIIIIQLMKNIVYLWQHNIWHNNIKLLNWQPYTQSHLPRAENGRWSRTHCSCMTCDLNVRWPFALVGLFSVHDRGWCGSTRNWNVSIVNPRCSNTGQ